MQTQQEKEKMEIEMEDFRLRKELERKLDLLEKEVHPERQELLPVTLSIFTSRLPRLNSRRGKSGSAWKRECRRDSLSRGSTPRTLGVWCKDTSRFRLADLSNNEQCIKHTLMVFLFRGSVLVVPTNAGDMMGAQLMNSAMQRLVNPSEQAATINTTHED